MAAQRAFEIDLDETFPHLPSSPVVEAVIHWVARARKMLDEQRLRETLANELPEYPKIQSQRILQFEATHTPDESRQVRREGWYGLRLTSEDGRFVIQFTRDGLVFSRLTPYHCWEEFSESGLRLWSLYCQIADPAEVQRLGVRFINRIPLADIHSVKRYLMQPPKCLDAMGLPPKSFMYQSIHDVPRRPYGIAVTRTVQPREASADEAIALIVDIDAFTSVPFETEADATRSRLRDLRWIKDKAFFSLMSKKAISEFSAERESS